MRLLSPAKANLFFRVLHKRSDGFHQIASLYQAIDLFDTLEFAKSGKDTLYSHAKDFPLDESNLIIKALQLFRKKTGYSQAFTIHVEKNIPQQAGLGGGSSNAATTLFACNAFSNLNIPIATLQSWSSELGSDVPFFFSSGSAYCTSRGELCEDVKLDPITFYIAKPSLALSTPSVFSSLELDEIEQTEPRKHLSEWLEKRISPRNDLELSSFKLLPELQEWRTKLLQLGFSHVVMTGSGTSFCCFGSVQDPKLDATTFYKVQSLSRYTGLWYDHVQKEYARETKSIR